MDYFDYQSPPWHPQAKEELSRFGLRDGQWYASFVVKNQQWLLNGKLIGFGDLSAENIENIALLFSEEGETFEGWHEHQWTIFQQLDVPMVRIVKGDFTFPYRERS